MATDFLLTPFKKWFRAPDLHTPVSTIEMPSTLVTFGLCALSFFAITSGFTYCYVHDMPTIGYRRGENGQPVATWMDPGLGSQYLGEGILAGLTMTLGACSMIAAFYVFIDNTDEQPQSQTSGQRKKLGNVSVKYERPQWFTTMLTYFAYTAPFWTFCAFRVFNAKIPSYFPSFRA